MRKLGFSLIELILVIVLIGVISFLVIGFPKIFPSSFNLYEALYPEGNITVYKNRIVSSKKVKFNCKDINVYVYAGGNFEKKVYPNKILFEYFVKNGIGESLILKCDKKFYVFKPFGMSETESLKKAEEIFTNKKYKPKIGSFY